MMSLGICFILSCTFLATKSTELVEWPFGTYTLVKPKAGCPTGWLEGWRYQDTEDGDYNSLADGHHFYGFLTGSVFWDDEDGNNENSYDGVLPSGKFDRNTRIDYCCREDGRYDTNIQLPTSQPFYLLRYTSYCQMVEGMYFREEKVEFDDEDHNNKNSISGEVPKGANRGRNQQLFYCYYWQLGSK
ncbi:uncharacterized protein LOC111106034 isoform X2 [Crassostrea virginica]